MAVLIRALRRLRTQTGSRTSDNDQCVDVACARWQSALASNLVRELKDLTCPNRRKRNLPPRIGILQDTVGHRASKRVFYQNAIGHQLRHMSGMGSREGTRAGF